MNRKPTLKLHSNEVENPLITLHNVVYLLSVEVSESSLKRVLLHPDYPALSSITQTLNSLGIETFAAQVSSQELPELVFPLIAHTTKFGGQFVIVTGLEKGLITYHDSELGWKTTSVVDFENIWSGVVVLLEKSQHAGETDIVEKRRAERLMNIRSLYLVAFPILIVGYSFMMAPLSVIVPGLLFILGFLCCIGIETSILGNMSFDSICKAGTALDCKQVVNSSAASLFGWIKLSDIGIIWFGTFLAVWTIGIFSADRLSDLLSVLAVLSIPAVAYTPFSVLYQAFSLRRWCVLCLIVQVVLVANVVVLSTFLQPFESLIETPTTLAIVGLSFATVSYTWIVLKPLLYNSKKLRIQEKDLFSFKLNTSVFKAMLAQQNPIPIHEFDRDIRVGPKDAQMQLVLVTNPLCDSCAEAYHSLIELQQRLGDTLSVVMRFAVAETDGSKFIINRLFSLEDRHLNEALERWYKWRNMDRWIKQYPTIHVEETSGIVNEHESWCNWIGLMHTPTIFLNGREIPRLYKPKDLAFLLLNLSPQELLIPMDKVETVA